MEFSEVLDRRRTYRDYSDREVSDEILDKVISAAFKAPTILLAVWRVFRFGALFIIIAHYVASN